jgi:hypothetical protein
MFATVATGACNSREGGGAVGIEIGIGIEIEIERAIKTGRGRSLRDECLVVGEF